MTLSQAPATVQLEWGETGALAVLAEGAGPATAIVIDVLSFTTVVTVAGERGSAVVPVASRDPAAAEETAARLGAVLAGLRGDGRVSLSPASLLRFDGGTVVVPAENGATICEALVAASATVIAGCLRNASAVAEEVEIAGRVLLVPAGELWPGGTLRPALEDLLGAGAIAARLRARGCGLSPKRRPPPTCGRRRRTPRPRSTRRRAVATSRPADSRRTSSWRPRWTSRRSSPGWMPTAPSARGARAARRDG
ncbi:hypothetical protein GCM10025881_27250 [Pseudolysinimonas kribbensis]|uniref:Probable 2-phosphosulfolactate phosphatase n=1 Tax=Pseudolysinimonas kribbensis TaxID=433641 RepID=A0ABQ6KBB7_9MICO|nr:2-phosphosulfolactate phosphatase [Pseudolysinimonas kribbensis]GMA95901.1 hypothetical protein GCM10025881_27250 [Pseudolysinimonas kribbensis]